MHCVIRPKSCLPYKCNLSTCLQSILRSTFSQKVLSYYDVLGAKQSSTDEEIKNAYFHKCKKYHPDKHHGSEAMHKHFIKINEAYQVLGDPTSRQQYDISLRQFTQHSNHRPFNRTSVKHQYPKYWYKDAGRYEKHKASESPFGQTNFGRSNQFALVLFAVIMYSVALFSDNLRQKRRQRIANMLKIKELENSSLNNV